MAVRKANETPSIEKLQQEREHIEGLFADRINFYLVFAAGILIFVFEKQPEHELLKVALGIVVIVSVLMMVALLRTFLLVRAVLHEITTEHSEAPYSRYCQHLKWIPNANYLLFALPIAMTAFFVYALIHVWNG